MRFSAFVAILVLSAISTPATGFTKRAVAYYNPRDGGGSQLNHSGGAGEPLNVIISGLSSPEVLTQAGFLNYARAIGL